MPPPRQRLAILLACAGAHVVLIALVVLVRHERPPEPRPMQVELLPLPTERAQPPNQTGRPAATTPAGRPPVLHQPAQQISRAASKASGAAPSAADLMAAPFADPGARKRFKAVPSCVTQPDPNDWSVPLCPPPPIARAPQPYETEARDDNSAFAERARHNDEMRGYHEDWDGDRKYPGLRCALLDRRC